MPKPAKSKTTTRTGLDSAIWSVCDILSSVERTGVDKQRNLLDALDKIHEISLDTVDDTHVFALSQIYVKKKGLEVQQILRKLEKI